MRTPKRPSKHRTKHEAPRFTTKGLLQVIKDMQSGKLPPENVRILKDDAVQIRRVRRKKFGVPFEKSLFTEENFLKIIKDFKLPGHSKLKRVTVVDDMVIGLHAKINKSGLIAYHVTYEIGDERPYFKLGDGNPDSDEYITVETARDLSKTIKALADRGVDVRDGLHRRIVREIREQGMGWRPE